MQKMLCRQTIIKNKLTLTSVQFLWLIKEHNIHIWDYVIWVVSESKLNLVDELFTDCHQNIFSHSGAMMCMDRQDGHREPDFHETKHKLTWKAVANLPCFTFTLNYTILNRESETWGSHGGKDVKCHLLGYDCVVLVVTNFSEEHTYSLWSFSETLVTIYKTMWCHNLEDY
jgi:hypothetical protein